MLLEGMYKCVHIWINKLIIKNKQHFVYRFWVKMFFFTSVKISNLSMNRRDNDIFPHIAYNNLDITSKRIFIKKKTLFNKLFGIHIIFLGDMLIEEYQTLKFTSFLRNSKRYQTIKLSIFIQIDTHWTLTHPFRHTSKSL